MTDAGPCPDDQLQRQYELAWASQDAISASMEGPDGTRPVEPSGTTTWCAPRAPVPSFTLTVTGLGGSTSQTASPG